MAAPVTAVRIKELRDRTGLGMGKCKEALEEAGGDMELAIDNLRKKGMASAVKKEGRSTNEGTIVALKKNNKVGLVEINAETDFVVRNDRFQSFLNNLAEELVTSDVTSLESFLQQSYSKGDGLTVDEFRATLVQVIGENIVVRRIANFKVNENQSVGIYSHAGGKIVVVVVLEGSSDEEALAKDIAMHAAAAAPEYLSPAEVPAEIIQKEREIAKEQVSNKPANIIEKIVEGKINAFYDACCLLHQNYIKDEKLTVAQVVEKRAKEIGKPLKLTKFFRWSVAQ